MIGVDFGSDILWRMGFVLGKGGVDMSGDVFLLIFVFFCVVLGGVVSLGLGQNRT